MEVLQIKPPFVFDECPALFKICGGGENDSRSSTCSTTASQVNEHCGARCVVRKPVEVDAQKSPEGSEQDETDANELAAASVALLNSLEEGFEPLECSQWYPADPPVDLDTLLFGRII